MRTIIDQVDNYHDDVFTAQARSFLQGLEKIEAAQQNLPQIYQPQPTSAASTSTSSAVATAPPSATPAPAAILAPAASAEAMVMEESTTADSGELALFSSYLVFILFTGSLDADLEIVVKTLESLTAALDEDPSQGSIAMVIHNLAAYLELRLAEMAGVAMPEAT
jgi:hypothetical protein